MPLRPLAGGRDADPVPVCRARLLSATTGHAQQGKLGRRGSSSAGSRAVSMYLGRARRTRHCGPVPGGYGGTVVSKPRCVLLDFNGFGGVRDVPGGLLSPRVRPSEPVLGFVGWLGVVLHVAR